MISASVWTRAIGSFGASIAVVACLATDAKAQSETTQRIERVAGKSVSGRAYARLRRLTYQQCEARCLADRRCVALEFFKGQPGLGRSYNCALYSAVGVTRDSTLSDVGFKRTVVVRRGTGGVVASRPDSDGARRAYRKRSVDDARREREPDPRASGGSGTGWTTRTEPGSSGSGSSSRSLGELKARPSPEPRAAERSLGPRPQPLPPVVASRPAPPPAALPRSAPVARGFDAGGTRGIGGAPTAAAPASQPPEAPVSAEPVKVDYHTVPVFYGTDRKRADTVGQRVAYGNDRARRLELGHAVITVPLDHKVPNIERPAAWTLPWFGTIWQEKEDPKRHFTVKEIKAVTKQQMLDLVRQRLGASSSFKDQSIVFIHGYNVGFDDSLYRTAQITYDLQFDGAAFTYSWPSGSGWTSYPYDRDSAQQAEPYLYEFLQMVQNETGTKSINIIAHSMGNQILLQVLRDLKRRSPAVSKINQIVLAAPDVDRDAFEFLASEIQGVAKGITLYASASDKALDASRIFAGNRPRAGDVPAPPSGPVVVAGIDTIDISAVSTGYLALNHSSYAEHSELLTDLNHLIRTGLRPPNLRITAYKRVNGTNGTYWRYGN